ncbi:MAG: glycosyltransferase family 2 protein [Verrucomicrobiales bacterium]|jgi:dolichol-phosphate mannosyltransferase|nr:glycosyltransferase family 2 protein [Verrucomicrobiales bacterium]
MKTLSVVVPCYNEESGLPELHRRLSRVCRSYFKEYQIIYINDGSRDATWEVMGSLAQGDPHVEALNLSRNFGHQVALTAGLERATGGVILIIDGDLQDPPELLGEMLLTMREGYDVVYGKRRRRTGESWFKKITAYLFYRLMNYCADIEIPTDTGDFRLISRQALDAFLQLPERSRFIRGMVCWVGFRQAPVFYERHRRYAGKSGYSVAKMLRFAADAITGFSIRPLRLALFVGLGFLLLAGLGAVLSLFGWQESHLLAACAGVAAVVLLAAAVQLFILGIIGEYIGRIFIESKQRPLYVIKDVIRAHAGGDEVEKSLLASI